MPMGGLVASASSHRNLPKFLSLIFTIPVFLLGPQDESRCYADCSLSPANFITECKESKACSPAKHHFDECVERVTGADHGKPVDKKHPEEDCVEECQSKNCSYLGPLLMPHSLPSRSLRN